MKIAVVTGASYGLGKKICEKLLKNDFKIYGISRTKPLLENNNLIWIKANLYSDSDIKSLVDKINEDRLDLLVNNAGTHIEESALDFSQENFHKIFDLNFIAPILITKALSIKLNNGLIINISSTSDRFVEKNSGLYSASKSALNIYFDILALENKSLKILNILPDYVDTPLQHRLSDKSNNFDWTKCVTPEEIANFIFDTVTGKYDLISGIRIIVVNNKSMSATKDPEILYYYNTDTKKIKKLK